MSEQEQKITIQIENKALLWLYISDMNHAITLLQRLGGADSIIQSLLELQHVLMEAYMSSEKGI